MTKKESDAATGDVQKQVDDAEAKGFFGVKVDPIPDSEYTLQSGPASPPAVSGDRARIEQVPSTGGEG